VVYLRGTNTHIIIDAYNALDVLMLSCGERVLPRAGRGPIGATLLVVLAIMAGLVIAVVGCVMLPICRVMLSSRLLVSAVVG
jgi:cytochrome b subunit of formate dehydrogenase